MSELYIRSQDRELLKPINAIGLGYCEFGNKHTVRHGCFTVGTYESMERCLEIMDEIQERICQLHAGSHHEPVYEMPEK